VDAKRFQGFGGEIVVAQIGSEAEFAIGFDRVEALILQLVSLQFVEQADTAAFLRQVENDSRAIFGDFAERELELRAAIAAFGCEDVAGEALRVDADKRRLAGLQLSVLNRHSFVAASIAANPGNRETAKARRQIGFGYDVSLLRLFSTLHRSRTL